MIYILLCLLGIIIITAFVLKRIKKSTSILEIIIGIIYVSVHVLLFVGLQIHNNQYYIAIDPIDVECYTPFGGKHIITLIFYYIAFNVSILMIWSRGHKLPPLAKVLLLSVFLIGIIVNFFVLLQLSKHNVDDLDGFDAYGKSDDLYFFLPAPIMSILISIFLTIHIVKNKMMMANEKTYSNKFLNKINLFLAQRNNLPLWSIILLIPLLLVITIILILFGQDSNSLVKVFTDTATWRLSQQIHPSFLDHKGHYLCTVAVSGNPKIVKPIRLGKRHGKTIIVNRQLLIANAFEEMIENLSPKSHRLIRSNYDKYGYNLSRKINTEQMSNLTYILMKPLEWIFLICLYLFCKKPEERINKQYAI
ncbi:hypothetical protein FNW52_03695 [Flavobacterium sp. ZT3R18]|uniref:DUF6688 domain-containing protein n=1 Tax=Flavobacterium sp. ZT3R18 TaxID=2594429 RepID=UPI00117BA078|nr:DUF6688 family protein [Flavobacterium sp. ZT3R18]TRX38015.1 hypothetical protein FNW52_03695 [Flavobacterium sp. ZT3R18]